MREGWEYKRLGECTQILDSQRKPVTKKDRKEGIYPYYGATGIQDYVDKYIFDGRYVLVGEDGAKWGAFDKSAFIIDGKTWVNNHAHVLKPFEPLVDSYLTYYLNYSDLNGFISGAIVRKLTQSSLKNIKIPLPPKSTQLAIVSELDKINELIRLKKEQLKDFDNLAQSLFYEMFGDPVENEKGWEVKKLNEIVSDNCSISYGIVQPGDGVENGVPVVRPVDMTKTFVSRKGLKNTTKEISDSYKRTILKGNEILMCVRGTTGLISMATPELQGCNVTRGIAPIECGPTCDKWFVFYQILNPAIQHHIAEYTRGIALKQINMKDVRDIPLCLPPLPLQHLFAQRIEQIEHQKSEVQKAITDLETLLASRMQYWFE